MDLKERLGGVFITTLFGAFLYGLLSAVPIQWSHEQRCRRNMGRIVAAQRLYAEDHDGIVSVQGWWREGLAPYLSKSQEALPCPESSPEPRNLNGGYYDLLGLHARRSRIKRRAFGGHLYTVGAFDQERDPLLKCLFHGVEGYRFNSERRYLGKALTAYLDGRVTYAPPAPCWDIDRMRALSASWAISYKLPTACDDGTARPVDFE
ncbi:hypothetical protein EON79_17085 [bacterium]|nr:MAG: hypothetical protein EON79_17085 [bacterium]